MKTRCHYLSEEASVKLRTCGILGEGTHLQIYAYICKHSRGVNQSAKSGIREHNPMPNTGLVKKKGRARISASMFTMGAPHREENTIMIQSRLKTKPAGIA
ncbi:hypothetical protein GWI33_019349 [Rhynchophorus ferrugineus]|uniref:Uncharacterized protein n=1 Tax=Rhynchophorus ferrugineus TaxID=354439 RepID=A0A834HU16_RHYFE|nr:hypothetical protein GWI33_019349 [Rhynchophorus ferrugineus]